MRKGKRYESEPKLNIKKVIAVFIAIIVIAMFIIAIKNLINSDSSASRLVSTTYFLINKDQRWGVIDNNSKIIIEPQYDDAIIIPNNKKDVFICTYNVDYNNGTYKTKVLNSKNKELFTEYESVTALENYDKNNNLWYEEDVLLVKKEGKYGLINLEGNVLLEPNFDNIYTLKGVKDSIITVKDDKFGLVNNLGKEVVENKYDDIKPLGDNTKYYIVKQEGKYGIYSITDCIYEDIKQLDNKEIYCVKKDKKYIVINKKQQEVFNEKFNDIEAIKDGIIVYNYNGEYCAFNTKTNTKLDKFYKELKYTSNNMFIAKIENEYIIINEKGENLLTDKYKKINYYEDGKIYELEKENEELNLILDSNLKEIAKGIINKVDAQKEYIKVWDKEGYKYYKWNGEQKLEKDIFISNNLFLSKNESKYGFVDKDGNVVVDFIYDDAVMQNEFGYIAVKKDGLWGSLDKNGNVISDTIYNLDDNLLIDFIGKYHLGKDLNLMYYTDK